MTHTVEYYLSTGCDRPMAEYLAGEPRRLTKVIPNRDYTLTLTFDNGERRLLDMRPAIQSTAVFAFLADWENFRRVYLDDVPTVAWDINPDVDSDVVWNNKVDLCPDSCYVDSVPVKN